MSFTDPWLIPIGVVVVAALALGAVLVARRRAGALAGAGLSGVGLRRGVPTGQWFSVAALALLAVAAAGPSVDVPTPRSAGTVIVAVDVSASMSATDVQPSRLDVAKAAATELIDAQPDSVDIGVVAFESGALSAGVPTADHAAADAAVARLAPSGGTSLTQAILASLTAITGTTVTLPEDDATAPDLGDWSSATIVLLSDGEQDGDADSTLAAAQLAASAGVAIETVGVGTTEGTTVEADGFSVHTALDEAELADVAQATGGTYHPASDVAELDGLSGTIDKRLTVTDEPLPLAGPVGGIAVLLLGAGSALNLRRTGRLI